MPRTDSWDGISHVHHRGPVSLYLYREDLPVVARRELLHLPQILTDVQGMESRSAGKETVWRWAPEWLDGGRLVVRQYVHGGLFGGILGGLFISDRSMRRELDIAIYTHRAGLPVPVPFGVYVERLPGPFLKAYYLSREVGGAENLLAYLRGFNGKDAGVLGTTARFNLAKEVGSVIADFHQAGVAFGDLNLKNLLVRNGDDPEVFLVDFKKAKRVPRVSLKEGLQNLMRLDRSVLKWDGSRTQTRLTDRLRVLKAYLRHRREGEGEWKSCARRLEVRRPDHLLRLWRWRGAGRRGDRR